MNLIAKYFSSLNNLQLQKLESLYSVYAAWNSKINLISRKDMNYFYLHHVLHSLSLAKFYQFKSGSRVMDVGTGGGFPGIPLSIFFPDVNFHLVDSIGKKIKVVRAVAEELGLKNVRTAHERAENINEKFDFVVSRAVTRMPAFLKWVEGKFSLNCNNTIPNGVLYLKGGDLTEEMRQLHYHHNSFNLSDYFSQDFFETKKVVYVQMV